MFIGHQAQWKFLTRSVELEKFPHAFLFQGPAKVGKRTFALELAKLLNCQNSDFKKRPCQQCFVCRGIEKHNLPDLILVNPIKKEISIDQIRDLSWRMSLSSYILSWKVAILDQAHFLGKAAQNCFLKTLEEPKPKTCFILITEYPSKFLPTVRSRTREVKFFQVPSSEIEHYLRKKGVEKERIQEIIRFSVGRPGQAIDFFKDPLELKSYKSKIEKIEEVLRQDFSYKFQYAKELSEKSYQELNQIFEIWLQRFRHLLASKAVKGGSDLLQLFWLKKNLEALEKTRILINFTNVNKKLALENLMLQLCSKPGSEHQ